MIRKALLSSAALAALTTVGFAADLPTRAVPVYAPAPIFTWTGFYVGATLGGAFTSNNNDGVQGFSGANPIPVAFAGFGTGVTPVTPGALVVNPSVSANASNGSGGVTGGGEIGYNLQFGQFVIGLEADIQGIARSRRASGFGRTNDTTGIGSAVAVIDYHSFGPTSNQRPDWFGTVRGRVGYAFDRVLVFATGGLAYTGDKCNDNTGLNAPNGCSSQSSYFNYYSPGSNSPVIFTNNASLTNNNHNNNIGYAVGGGLEYSITSNLSAKVEYLYVNLNRRNNNGAYNPNGVYTNASTGATITAAGGATGVFSGNNQSNSLNVIRVGVNYRFGAPAAPVVVAKY